MKSVIEQRWGKVYPFQRKITLAVQGIIDPDYGTYSKRICYARDAFRDRLDGLELGFFADEVDEIENALNEGLTRRQLGLFRNNSVHIAARAGCAVKSQTIDKIMMLCNILFQEHLICSVNFHLDMSPIFHYISSLADPGLPLCWENLGADAISGNTCEEAVKAIRNYPDWGIVFDIAHALEMESAGQPPPEHFLKTMGDRIRQIHFSWPGNLYTENQVGLNFETRHSLVHLDCANGSEMFSVLQNSQAEVITIEGVVPPGSVGKQLVMTEIDLIKKATSGSWDHIHERKNPASIL